MVDAVGPGEDGTESDGLEETVLTSQSWTDGGRGGGVGSVSLSVRDPADVASKTFQIHVVVRVSEVRAEGGGGC